MLVESLNRPLRSPIVLERVQRPKSDKSGFFGELTIYPDRALSGASPLRPAFQKLMADARAATFDVVISDGLDPLSREQVTTAWMFQSTKSLPR